MTHISQNWFIPAASLKEIPLYPLPDSADLASLLCSCAGTILFLKITAAIPMRSRITMPTMTNGQRQS